MRILFERDLETLNELVGCTEELERRMDRKYAQSVGFSPIYFGGGSNSHHGKTALKLVKYGFVDAKKRGKEWGDTTTRDARGSNVYRATPAGRAAIEAWRQLRGGTKLVPGQAQMHGKTVPSSTRVPLTEEDRKLLRQKCYLEKPE